MSARTDYDEGTAVDRRVRDNLCMLLAMVKLQGDDPPATAASALSRAAGQIATLAALYDGAMETVNEVDAGSWCEALISSLHLGFEREGRIDYDFSAVSARIPQGMAQSLGLALGELLSDAAKRSRDASSPYRVRVWLARSDSGRVALRLRDEAMPADPPRVATLIASAIGCELRAIGSESGTEREILFPPSAS